VIAERGVDLGFRDFGSSGGDGVYLWNGKRGLIVVNAAKLPLRQRFTAAHELGHHEMHRPAKQQLILADEDVEAAPTKREREANAFAANLLAPDRALRQELVGRAPDSIEPIDVVQLSRRYGLSYSALLYRLLHSGCIRPRDKERLQQAIDTREVAALMKAIGFDAEKVFPPGPALPDYYVLAVVHLHERGALSDERLGELLRRPASEAVELAHGEAGNSGAANLQEVDALLGG
jgi:Zn-dependent peptidase ImmA (M78 family)